MAISIKHPLNFDNKWWERIGLVTDKGGDIWNKGFIDGFNHGIYTLVITQLLFLVSPLLGVLSYLMLVVVFILLEFYQGYKGNKEGWEIVKWYDIMNFSMARKQDILFPVFFGLLVIVRFFCGY